MPARGWLPLFVLVFLAHVAPGRADEWKDADRELNVAYQIALRGFPGDRQESMRRAQRAWITFSDRNEAAFKTFANNRGFGGNEVGNFILAAIRDQRDVLRGFGQVPNLGRDATQSRLAAADAEMTSVYQGAIRGASAAEEQRLREAQRAWITWRDENARALYRANPQGEALLGSLRLTMNRARELRRFLPGASGPAVPTAPPGSSDAPDVFATAVPSSAPSTTFTEPERATAPTVVTPRAPATLSAEQTREVEALASESLSLLERTADALPPLSTVATGTLADLPGLPPDLAAGVAGALVRVRTLGDELREANLRPPEGLGRAAAALALLDGLRRGLDACRTGDSPAAVTAWASAGGEVAARRLNSPAVATLRTRLEALGAALNRQAAEAAPHLARATDAAKLGRTAEAIRELELAHRLYPDPAVPERIRRLRESSLGL